LKFPPQSPVETWVSDAAGDPLLVVMAEPAASLAAELRRLIPELRATVGDDRRVLVGFDRGGWSPTLFADPDAAGFDTHSHTDEHGPTYTWRLAGRWAGLAQIGAQRLPDIGGQRHPALAGRLALQDDPPGAPVEVVQLQPRRLDRSQAQACDQRRGGAAAVALGCARLLRRVWGPARACAGIRPSWTRQPHRLSPARLSE
jgi:hypothetical protein